MDIINDFHNLKRQKRLKIWKPFMEKYNCQKICELGVRRGHNFMRMVEHGPELAVAVDLWAEVGVPSINDGFYTQEVLDDQYETFKEDTKDMPFVKIHRDYTEAVAKEYPDNFFDLVFIDADHTLEGAMKDMVAWYPKVREGGLLMGHDFRNMKRKGIEFGVTKAVMQFARRNKLWFFVDGLTIWGIIK